MAAKVYPNTIFAENLPPNTGYNDLMLIFGRHLGRIDNVDFITTSKGEKKAAFLQYQNYSSIEQALQLEGRTWPEHPGLVLKVRVVDEELLTQYAKGSESDVSDLQKVLRDVVESRKTAQKDLNTLRKKVRDFEEAKTKAEKEAIEKANVLKICQGEKNAIDQRLQAVISRYNQMKAENDRLTAQHVQDGSIARTLQAKIDFLNNQLMSVQNRFKEKDEQPMEELETTMSDLARLQVSAEHIPRRASGSLRVAVQGHRDSSIPQPLDYLDGDKKRRKQSSAAGEPDAKRWRGPANSTSGHDAAGSGELHLLEARLKEEIAHRTELEKLLSEANAKLDRTIVTDSLLSAFLEIEEFAKQTAQGLGQRISSSN
ncbi:hypothetical protein M422DRAFT_246682 [Sphaerobolus stellatus SS14]|nr:hypothetical protein M422DRAFT_246682 [Sphaerobolus stellatus SS14]